jgi:hypothetical protein
VISCVRNGVSVEDRDKRNQVLLDAAVTIVLKFGLFCFSRLTALRGSDEEVRNVFAIRGTKSGWYKDAVVQLPLGCRFVGGYVEREMQKRVRGQEARD